MKPDLWNSYFLIYWSIFVSVALRTSRGPVTSQSAAHSIDFWPSHKTNFGVYSWNALFWLRCSRRCPRLPVCLPLQSPWCGTQANVCLMRCQRLRRWHRVKLTLGQDRGHRACPLGSGPVSTDLVHRDFCCFFTVGIFKDNLVFWAWRWFCLLLSNRIRYTSDFLVMK